MVVICKRNVKVKTIKTLTMETTNNPSLERTSTAAELLCYLQQQHHVQQQLRSQVRFVIPQANQVFPDETADTATAKPQTPFLGEGNESSISPENAVEFDEERFVEEIRKYECIWDTKYRAYKDNGKKRNAWFELCTLF